MREYSSSSHAKAAAAAAGFARHAAAWSSGRGGGHHRLAVCRPASEPPLCSGSRVHRMPQSSCTALVYVFYIGIVYTSTQFLTVQVAATTVGSSLARINPWLSACDLAQPASAPDLQGQCAREEDTPLPVISSRDSDRISTATSEQLDQACRLSGLALRRALAGMRLRHCREHTVLDSLQTDALRGGTLCRRAVADLMEADVLAARISCEFNEVLVRYDCDQPYSIITHCEDCKVSTIQTFFMLLRFAIYIARALTQCCQRNDSINVRQLSPITRLRHKNVLSNYDTRPLNIDIKVLLGRCQNVSCHEDIAVGRKRNISMRHNVKLLYNIRRQQGISHWDRCCNNNPRNTRSWHCHFCNRSGAICLLPVGSDYVTVTKMFLFIMWVCNLIFLNPTYMNNIFNHIF